MLPAPLRSAVEAELGPVLGASSVAGGCVSPSLRVELRSGPVFLKYNDAVPAGFFRSEARGLQALRVLDSGLRVPEVLAVCDAGPPEPAWLALEWLEPAPPAADFGERLGHGLAALHRAGGGGGWGWGADGFIGSLPQENAPAERWVDFWAERRLGAQLRIARAAGVALAADPAWERLSQRLEAALEPAEADGPSLLHGDLWSGNAIAVGTGEPALVDPAAYRGHREVDLAMSELFGGFPPDFHAAYRESWPLLPGYEVRRGIYQLFYLLVHVNLFGGGYLDRTAAALRRLEATP